MKSNMLLAFIISIAFSVSVLAADPVISAMDKAIIKNKLEKFSKDRSLPMGDLVLKIGLDFLNTPYVGKTLDKTKDEKLVVNLHQLDCTTFAENCLALARTIKSDKPGIPAFCSELESIRYRGGKMEGYASRLHYFSEWIQDNETREHVKAMAASMGGSVLPISLNIMSTHPEEYPQLINDPAITAQIKAIEEKVSAQKFYYIPTNKFESIEGLVNDGDIVTLTTTIPGIDVSHVGILLKKEGRVYLLHASSTAQKVMISAEPFAQYLTKSKKTTGVMIARPIE
ncbi:MAG: N-acetylmuramoyl-L-alanine amidase-like domain-containing protein [Prolixibacteraceae bacterium]